MNKAAVKVFLKKQTRSTLSWKNNWVPRQAVPSRPHAANFRGIRKIYKYIP